MLWTIKPRYLMDELLSRGPVALAFQGSCYLARPDADAALAERNGRVGIYVPGVGGVEVEGAVYGVEAEHTDAKCLGNGCNEFRLQEMGKRVARIVKVEV